MCEYKIESCEDTLDYVGKSDLNVTKQVLTHLNVYLYIVCVFMCVYLQLSFLLTPFWIFLVYIFKYSMFLGLWLQ